jgi:hypothetical protein
MSEPSLSEIAKVPAGSAFNDRGAALEEESWRRLTQRNPLRNVRPHWEIWLLRHRKTRRTTGYTFFERRAGTNNRGNLEHTVDLIRGGLSVTRQETPGFPQVREVTFVITESNSRSPFSIAGGASPFTPRPSPLSRATPVTRQRSGPARGRNDGGIRAGIWSAYPRSFPFRNAPAVRPAAGTKVPRPGGSRRVHGGGRGFVPQRDLSPCCLLPGGYQLEGPDPLIGAFPAQS